MDVISLKKYIYEENKIEYILEQIGCHNIRFNAHKDYYSASQPDGDNLMGVCIRNNEYLSYRSFSRNVNYDDGRDLISLVEEIKNISFAETIRYLHNLLGLEFVYKKAPEKKKKSFDPLNVFKKIKERNRCGIVNVDDIHVLDNKLIDDYIPLLHIDWLKEGIMPWTREKFKLAYSYKHKRVVIPMRYWLTGELLGFNQRTTVENYKEFAIKKYFITPTYPKHINLYGLYENYDDIQKAGYVVVAESEKSVLKRDSLGDSTVVALSGKSISDEQVRILIGLNVEVVIGLDNDVDVSEVRHVCEKFKNVRKVSYIHDFMGILGSKDAPMDASNKDYQFLLESRIVYDRSEQRKYQESLKNK